MSFRNEGGLSLEQRVKNLEDSVNDLSQRHIKDQLALATLGDSLRDLKDIMEGTGMLLDALVNKVFPDRYAPPVAGKGDRTPEEVERTLKTGIRIARLKPREQLLCISFVAGYLEEDGLLSTDQASRIKAIVAEVQ